MHETHPAIPLIALAPFVLMLGAIAILPLSFAHFWEKNHNKLLVAAALAVPTGIYLLAAGMGEHLWHALVFDYVPFLILLGSLFVITGGISVTGDIEARPIVNTAFLGIGAVFASF